MKDGCVRADKAAQKVREQRRRGVRTLPPREWERNGTAELQGAREPSFTNGLQNIQLHAPCLHFTLSGLC